MDLSPILSVIHTVTIGTILHFNGGLKKLAKKRYKQLRKVQNVLRTFTDRYNHGFTVNSIIFSDHRIKTMFVEFYVS